MGLLDKQVGLEKNNNKNRQSLYPLEMVIYSYKDANVL